MTTTSEALSKLIQLEMAGKTISFARFMELALYTPLLGYYSTHRPKIGKHGDFITAPEISPLFAQCVAKQCLQILESLGHGDILELGAGTGQFAKDILLALEQLDSLPTHYYILEISAALRDEQQALLQQSCPHLLSRVRWLTDLPENGIQGIIFANEVLDALPVHRFHIADNQIKECCVVSENNRFTWQIAEPTTSLLTESINPLLPLPDGYESEINLMLPGFIKQLANALNKGTILLIDYGYGRDEYYHPDRSQGTFMCFYQHQQHTNPFLHVGEQDITAHVDFTEVATEALDNSLTLAGYTTQASFLLACGLLEFSDANQHTKAIKLLTLPSEMGEIIKVMGLNKALDLPLLGFALQDRRRNL